jgi:Rrf2 family protein
MRITRETDYAIRCVLYLSETPERVAIAGEIAEAKKIPKSFLSKILQKLVKAEIIESFRGVKGGVKLAKRPEDISLLDVITTIEGDVGINICAVNKRACNQSKKCSVHPVWVEIRRSVEEMMKRYNFENLRK